MTGAQLAHWIDDPGQAEVAIVSAKVFARIGPAQKLTIV